MKDGFGGAAKVVVEGRYTQTLILTSHRVALGELPILSIETALTHRIGNIQHQPQLSKAI